jgi:uncharacterized membrane protein YedE/YeeE
MANFTPISGLIGGILIGVASVLLLWSNGRIAGISGIVGGLLPIERGDFAWRLWFILGLIAGGVAWSVISREPLPIVSSTGLPVVLMAGFLVGFGTRLGTGCTSGHGICGIARRSPRSIVATLAFMGAGLATVFIVRHVL